MAGIGDVEIEEKVFKIQRLGDRTKVWTGKAMEYVWS